MAEVTGVLRVRSVIPIRRRAGIAFSSEWSLISPGEIDEAQYLAILKDPELVVEFGIPQGEFRSLPDRDVAIEVLQDHIDYDLARGRPHDLLGPIDGDRTSDDNEFHDAQGAETRTGADASSPGAAEAKGGDDAQPAAPPPADPSGTAPSAAGGAAEDRGDTTDEATAQGAASGRENQSADSPQPPIAAPQTETPVPEKSEPAKPSGSHRKAKHQAADKAD